MVADSAAFVLTLLSLLLCSLDHPFALRTFQIFRKSHTNMLLRAVFCSAVFVWPAQLGLSKFVVLSLNAVRPAFPLCSTSVNRVNSTTTIHMYVCSCNNFSDAQVLLHCCSITPFPGAYRVVFAYSLAHMLSLLRLLVAPLKRCSALRWGCFCGARCCNC